MNMGRLSATWDEYAYAIANVALCDASSIALTL